jgi:hypothetical protein
MGSGEPLHMANAPYRHAQTELGVDRKAAVGGEQADGGWLEGIGRREDYLAMIQAARKVAVV